MKEFVFGSDEQYDELERALSDGLCHVFRGCSLPSCGVEDIRIGFEKSSEFYLLYIDKGLICNAADPPLLFKMWLSDGVLRFIDFYDVKCFLRGLEVLYREVSA